MSETKHAAINALRAFGFGRERSDEQVGWRGVYPAPSTPAHFRCEFCQAEHLDCAEIDHSETCPVVVARRALSTHPKEQADV